MDAQRSTPDAPPAPRAAHAPTCWFASALLFLFSGSDAYAGTVWSQPSPIYALVGAGDVLSAATAGGVVLWDLSSERIEHMTTARGLPTQIALAVDIPPDHDELGVATTNGLARGWFDAGWRAFGARNDDKGVALYSCMARPGGRLFAGGSDGLLLAWYQQRLDSLRVPTRSGRVVSLAFWNAWVDAATARNAPMWNKPAITSASTLSRDSVPGSGVDSLQHSGEPAFPVGLVAALDNDGLWLLRSSRSWVRWLRFVQEDGLPSHRVRHVRTDSSDRLWIATDAGLAWMGADLTVHSFAGHPVLGQRVHVLAESAEGLLYIGLDDGLARFDPDRPEDTAVLIPGISGPIVALANTFNELWYSNGSTIASLTGRELSLPAGPAASYGLSILARGDTLWAGHPFGLASTFTNGAWVSWGANDGLPADGVTSLLDAEGRLYAGTASSGLFVLTSVNTVPLPRVGGVSNKAASGRLVFFPVAGAPAQISTQLEASGSHWVGGLSGLSVRRGQTWEQFPLWPGASEVVDLASAGDTLWASGARAGVAYHDGQAWTVPPCASELVGAYFGRLSRGVDGRIVMATDRGIAWWTGLNVIRVPEFPTDFVTDIQRWGTTIAAGTHRGLWILDPHGVWRVFGVLDGLPGAQIRALDVDPNGSLWVATTRGIGLVQPLAPDADAHLFPSRDSFRASHLPNPDSPIDDPRQPSPQPSAPRSLRHDDPLRSGAHRSLRNNAPPQPSPWCTLPSNALPRPSLWCSLQPNAPPRPTWNTLQPNAPPRPSPWNTLQPNAPPQPSPWNTLQPNAPPRPSPWNTLQPNAPPRPSPWNTLQPNAPPQPSPWNTLQPNAPPQAENTAPGMSVSLYDVRGRLVRRIQVTSAGAWHWDARDSEGKHVPTGVYYVQSHPMQPVRRILVRR